MGPQHLRGSGADPSFWSSEADTELLVSRTVSEYIFRCFQLLSLE